MVRFVCTLIVYMSVSIFCLFIVGHGKFKITLNKVKTKQWSKKARQKVALITQLLLNVVGLAVAILVVVPLMIDIPAMEYQNFETIEGVPSFVNTGGPPKYNWFPRQTLYLDNGTDKQVAIYFYLYPRLNTHTRYRITYLPNSHFGVEAQIVDENGMQSR